MRSDMNDPTLCYLCPQVLNILLLKNPLHDYHDLKCVSSDQRAERGVVSKKWVKIHFLQIAER